MQINTILEIQLYQSDIFFNLVIFDYKKSFVRIFLSPTFDKIPLLRQVSGYRSEALSHIKCRNVEK